MGGVDEKGLFVFLVIGEIASMFLLLVHPAIKKKNSNNREIA